MGELEGSELIAAARAIATIAHKGQVDKTGAPYIDHPRRVADMVDAGNEISASKVAAAWLHDVLEDSTITAEDLVAAGISRTVVGYVELLTRKPGQSPEDYYEALRCRYDARDVKLADIADNTNPDRLALIEDDATVARLVRKYAKARLLLGVVK